MFLRNSSTERTRKSFTRHAKNLSQQSYIEHSQIDIIAQLKNYRAGQLKYSKSSISPNKPESYSHSPTKSGSREPLITPSAPTTARPTSTKRVSLLSARSGELGPLMQPSSNHFTERVLHSSVYHGVRTGRERSEDFSIIKLNDISHDKSEIAEIEISKQDEDEYKTFIESFSYLAALKFDLELNWEISSGKECVPPEKGNMGSFWILRDKIQNFKEINLIQMKHYKSDELIDMLKEYSRISRDVFRGIKSKGNNNNEVMMLEML